jgi:hypothetical protein
MSTAENLRMLDAARDMASETRMAIDTMASMNQGKTAKELAKALTAMLNSVAKVLDANGLA